MMFILEGRILQLDTPFEHDGTSYPANWLRLATPEERAAIGITEVVEQQMPDQRFFWVSGPNDDGSWTAIPKDLDGLKTTWKAQVKSSAYSILLPTDWLIVRHIEEGVEIPGDWKDWRSSVRTYAGTKSAEINAAQDIDEFIDAATSIAWPLDPDAIAAQNAAEADAPPV